MGAVGYADPLGSFAGVDPFCAARHRSGRIRFLAGVGTPGKAAGESRLIMQMIGRFFLSPY
jgi:hypothetical protein